MVVSFKVWCTCVIWPPYEHRKFGHQKHEVSGDARGTCGLDYAVAYSREAIACRTHIESLVASLTLSHIYLTATTETVPDCFSLLFVI